MLLHFHQRKHLDEYLKNKLKGARSAAVSAACTRIPLHALQYPDSATSTVTCGLVQPEHLVNMYDIVGCTTCHSLFCQKCTDSYFADLGGRDQLSCPNCYTKPFKVGKEGVKKPIYETLMGLPVSCIDDSCHLDKS
jgi:hypothetical protein